LLALLLLAACTANLETAPDEEAPAVEITLPQGGEFAVPALPVEPAITVLSPGQVFYVAPNGSNGDDGSSATPWLTIQHAVDNVTPGDTILLRSGTYAGARIEQSGTAAAWITLAAAPGAAALINSPGPNNKHSSNLEFETWEGDETVAYWLVEGLEVAAAPNWGIDLRGSEGNHSHDFIIRNNRVHDNGRDSGKSGIFTGFVDNVIVEGNESYSNGEHGIYLSNSGDHFLVRANRLHHNNNCGLHINGDLDSGADGIISDGLIENNIIYENGDGGCSGINMDGVTATIVRNNLLYENHAGGISIFQENGAVCSQDIQLLNNTIVQAEDGRWAINISDDACINNKIFNNIILTFHDWRGSIVIPKSPLSGFESDYNVIMDRFSADDDNSVITLSEWQALGYDSHSIITSPAEVFAGPNDYHLHPKSPALDAGLTLPTVKADIEGRSRPQGAAYDIGAYEFPGALSNQSFVPAVFSTGELVISDGTIIYTSSESFPTTAGFGDDNSP
jgi:parallel beta-helix repeat protein